MNPHRSLPTSLIGLLTIVVTMPALSAETERYQLSQVEMGLEFSIVLYAEDEESANAAAKAAFERIHDLNGILSDYDPESELSRLSDTAGSEKAVRVSDELMFVLDHARQVSEQSGGAFDVTIGPVVQLWRHARRVKELPDAAELQAALASVGYMHLLLDEENKTAKLLKSKMRLDLGGIAKGYAVDEALAVLKKHGITRAIVAGAGDMAIGDPPPDRAAWRIGVAPLNPSDPPSRYLLVSNCGVATSGDAFQHVEIGGARYSHLVDPKTGLGLTTRSASTVVAPSGIAADALASAVSVLGAEKGIALTDKIEGAAALVVWSEEGKVKTEESKGWEKLKISYLE